LSLASGSLVHVRDKGISGCKLRGNHLFDAGGDWRVSWLQWSSDYPKEDGSCGTGSGHVSGGLLYADDDEIDEVDQEVGQIEFSTIPRSKPL
jgi:hypothetical protein